MLASVFAGSSTVSSESTLTIHVRVPGRAPDLEVRGKSSSIYLGKAVPPRRWSSTGRLEKARGPDRQTGWEIVVSGVTVVSL